MKKAIILTWLMIAAFAVSAAEKGVFMEFHRKSNPGRNTQVCRTPMNIPIEVLYDSDAQTVRIVGDDSIVADVYIYDMSGSVEEYSSSLNVAFNITTPGIHIISIQGDGWSGEGTIQI